MTVVEKIISIAEAEVGYLEKSTNAMLDDKTANAGSNNFTKYARDLDTAGWFNGAKQGYAWCAVFVNWLFFKAFGKSKGLEMMYEPTTNNCAAVCTYGLQYYKNKGAFYTSNPQVGDQIFFGSVGNSGHTGIVYKVDSNAVYTIEGNTSAESGVIANGGAVAHKKYSKSNSQIAGYGRPNWSLASDEYYSIVTPVDDVSNVSSNPETSTASTAEAEPEIEYKNCKVEPYVLKKGMVNKQVVVAQRLLISYGFKVGVDGADGDFGDNTYSAIKRFQVTKGITATGDVDEATWNKLLGIK